MILPVYFDAAAEEELDAAATYYEVCSAGLARPFLRTIDEAVFRLRENPKLHSKLPDISLELDVRRVLVSRFPYSLAYLELPTEIRVIAVAHARKRPEYWRGRVPPT